MRHRCCNTHVYISFEPVVISTIVTSTDHWAKTKHLHSTFDSRHSGVKSYTLLHTTFEAMARNGETLTNR